MDEENIDNASSSTSFAESILPTGVDKILQDGMRDGFQGDRLDLSTS